MNLDALMKKEAQRIARLPTFEEKRLAANAFSAAHPLPDIYVFYRLINDAIQARA